MSNWDGVAADVYRYHGLIMKHGRYMCSDNNMVIITIYDIFTIMRRWGSSYIGIVNQ